MIKFSYRIVVRLKGDDATLTGNYYQYDEDAVLEKQKNIFKNLKMGAYTIQDEEGNIHIVPSENVLTITMERGNAH